MLPWRVVVLGLVLLVGVGADGARGRRRRRVASCWSMWIVGRGRRLLEGISLPHAAVYHTGEVHSHGEG